MKRRDYTTKHAAERYGITRERVTHIALNRGVGEKVEGRWRFSAEEIRQLKPRKRGRPRKEG